MKVSADIATLATIIFKDEPAFSFFSTLDDKIKHFVHHG
jgi:hypothetical protein